MYLLKIQTVFASTHRLSCLFSLPTPLILNIKFDCDNPFNAFLDLLDPAGNVSGLIARGGRFHRQPKSGPHKNLVRSRSQPNSRFGEYSEHIVRIWFFRNAAQKGEESSWISESRAYRARIRRNGCEKSFLRYWRSCRRRRLWTHLSRGRSGISSFDDLVYRLLIGSKNWHRQCALRDENRAESERSSFSGD